MRRPLLITLSAPAIAVSLAACSSATTGKGGTVYREPHSSVVTPSPFPSSTHPAPSVPPSSVAPVANELDAAMLAAGDIGPGFARVSNDPPAPLPCTPGRSPVDDQVEHLGKGDVGYVDRAGAVQVSEQIYVYGSVAAAVRHQQIVDTGLACRHGVLAGGGDASVLGPTDVSAELSARNDRAEAWAVRTAQISGALVQVRIHAVIVQFAVVARPGAGSTVDARTVVEAGLAKLIAHAG